MIPAFVCVSTVEKQDHFKNPCDFGAQYHHFGIKNKISDIN